MGLFQQIFTVMVVEDSAPQLKLIDKMLTRIEGVKSILCSDIFEAYAVLQAYSKVDMLVLDVNLPFAGGLSLLAKLRSMGRFAELPILISTAEQDVAMLHGKGSSGLLVKPYDAGQLKTFVDAFRNVQP